MKDFNRKAIKLNEQFKELKQQMIDMAKDHATCALINKVDSTAVRKLLNHPEDITPARLVSISTKIINKLS